MNINGTIILPHVYVLTFDTQYELCMSFVRIQEFYESASSKFRGKYFDLEDYMEYWATEFGHGSFDYPARWNGFNLSSKVIEKWEETFCGKFREWETKILKEISDLRAFEYCESNGEAYPEKYYIIGVHKQQSPTSRNMVIEHEVAHALYYLSPDYKKKVNGLIKNLPKKIYNEAEKKLVKMGYGKNVIKDEIQAYFSIEGLNGFKSREEFVANIRDCKDNLKK